MTILSNGMVGVATTAPRPGILSNVSNTAIPALDVAGQVYGRLPVFVHTGTTLDISIAASNSLYSNSYIYLTNSGFSNITIPSVLATSNGGTFFQLKNSTTAALSVTITGTVNVTSPIAITPSNAITFVVSPNASNTMLVF
jgi:hypothetical protein